MCVIRKIWDRLLALVNPTASRCESCGEPYWQCLNTRAQCPAYDPEEQ